LAIIHLAHQNIIDRYGGYYGHYESESYLDQYDGNPYTDNLNPYENGSPYKMN
jgi:hypothetical protein